MARELAGGIEAAWQRRVQYRASHREHEHSSFFGDIAEKVQAWNLWRARSIHNYTRRSTDTIRLIWTDMSDRPVARPDTPLT